MAHASTKSLIKKYIIGYIVSLILTTFSFSIVWYVISSPSDVSNLQLTGFLLSSATFQLIIQLVLFLHLGSEPKPRWNLYSFLFMALILGVVVIGSLWIMANLDYHMMSPEAMSHYMEKARTGGF